MTQATGSVRAPVTAWKSESLRLSMFYSPNELVSFDGVWEEVVGQPPETTNKKPKTRECAEVGKYEGAQLIIHAKPNEGRIDWLFSFDPTTDTDAFDVPTATVMFLHLMGKFFRCRPLTTVNRVAFGSIVLLPVVGHNDGYSTISKYLKFEVDGRSSSDFQYQINRKRESKVLSSLLINRLTRWSVGKTIRTGFMLTDAGLVALNSPDETEFNCRLELDINTDSESNVVLLPEKTAGLVSELAQLANEIIQDGDIA